MEVSSAKKSYCFKIVPNQRRRPAKSIENQLTLVGSYFDLRMSQKLLLALLKVEDTAGAIKTIVICFKVEAKEIPDGVRNLSIKKMNLANMKVADCQPIPILIIVVADDSNDLQSSYQMFLAGNAKATLENFQPNVNYIVFNGIKLEKNEEDSNLTVTPIKNYQAIQKKIESVKKRPKVKQTNQPEDQNNQTPSTSGNISHADNDSQQSTAKKRKYSCLKPGDLKGLIAKTDKISYESVRIWAVELVDVLKKFVDPDEVISSSDTNVASTSSQSENNREIPEEDLTYERGQTTFIEGLLPVPSRSYRAAMRSQNQKASVLSEPSFWLSNIVRDCFPQHWLIGTTIRGQGGKTSLVSIWNYHIPDTDPCGGFFEDGLGERRLRALFDHVVRKTKKSSYDKTVEKHLLDSLAKYMHYSRVRAEQKQPKKRKRMQVFESDDDATKAEESNTLVDVETQGFHGVNPIIHLEQIDMNVDQIFASDDDDDGSQSDHGSESDQSVSKKKDEIQKTIPVVSLDGTDGNDDNPLEEETVSTGKESEQVSKENENQSGGEEPGQVSKINSESDKTLSAGEESRDNIPTLHSEKSSNSAQGSIADDESSRLNDSGITCDSPSSSSSTVKGQKTLLSYYSRTPKKSGMTSPELNPVRKLDFTQIERVPEEEENQVDDDALKSIQALLEKNPKNKLLLQKFFQKQD